MKEVLKCAEQLEIGKVYGGGIGEELTDDKGNYEPAPKFIILGHATEEDYKKYCNEVIGKWDDDCLKHGDYYYWVSMD